MFGILRKDIYGFLLIFLIFFGTFYFFFSFFNTPYASGYVAYEPITWASYATATAYNSLESQTDLNPWVTASGTRCRWGIVASNFLPFGTKLKIQGFGDKIFVVEDRMHKRFKKHIDIWFPKYSQAREFGKRQVKFTVIVE